MPTLTRSQAHIVVAISGKPAYVRGADGKLHLLKVGDLVTNGEQILTTQGGIVELRDRIDPAVAKQADETDAVIEALNRDDADAATAAGNAGGDGGGFQPGLRVDRISESTTSASLLTTGIDRSSTDVTERATAPELQLSAATPPVVTPPVNAAPVAIAASASGAEDTTLPISLTGQDPDGSVVSITVTGLPANGVLLLGDGVTPVAVGQSLTPAQAAALLFRPDADLNGNTQIGFTVTDNQGAVSSPAQVQIAVTAVNDAPVAAPNTGITAEDTPVSGNVLDNDSDVDSATLTVTQFTVGGTTFAAGIPAGLPGVGTLVIQSDGSFTFTPAPNFNGTVPVASYVVSDGSLSASSTLSLSVSPVNDPPVAADDNVTTDEDTPVTLGVSALLGNDSDADGNPLTLVSVQAPVNGTVALVGGNVVFTPAPDYNGPASFSYTITDGQGGTSTATVVVDVKPVIDPAISISDVTVNEAAGTATFTVTLDQATTATVSVGYGSADGSATAGADFGAVSGTLTFAPGVTSQTITVPITNDAVFEGGETFNIKLTAPINATLADDTGIGTIRDDGTGSGGSDNDTPVISVSAGNALEGTSAVFTVSLSNASTSPVVFTPSLASGSAVVGTDTAAASALEVSTDGGASWSVVSGNVTIAAGSTSVQLRLPTTDDTLAETSETFSLTATPVSGAVAAAASASATIIDNDGPPSLFIDDVTVNEAAGTVSFTVSLSTASGLPVSVSYGSADGSAVAGSDYTAALGTLTFAPGVTSQTVTVAITNDTVFEASETFNINLSSPVNATIADGTGVGTIVDNDAAPTITTVSSPTVVEGTDLVYSVALSNASSTASTFAYSLGGGSAAAADYGSPTFSNGVTLAAGVLTVPAGVTSFTVTLPTTQDTLNETSETVPLSIGGVAGTGTITDNDPTPSLSINDVSVNEAAGTATFTVTLSAASGQSVSVGYASADGSATAGSDYAAAIGTLTFAPGVTSQTVTVSITNDTVFEASETFNINLSSPVNATIADGTGVGTIVDNDAAPTIATVSSPTVVEGSDLVYTVALTNASSSASTFAYALGGGSAAAADYGSPTFSNGVTLAAGVLTVPAGVTSFTVTLPTTQDTLNEVSETVPLSVGGVAGTGTITDNDPTPSLSINDVSVNEAAGTATFTVTLSAASGQAVSVGYASADGSATGADYAAVAGTLTFAPGVTSQTVTVAITNDTVFEGNEAFSINLSSPVNATIADGTGIGTIVDNDAAPTIATVSSASAVEAASIVHTVTLSNPSASASTYSLALTDGTATGGGTDYTSTLTNAAFSNGVTISGGVITVPAGVTSFTVSVPTSADTIDEANETYTLSVGAASGTGTITDDDAAPTIASVSSPTVVEGTDLVYSVALSNASSSASTFAYSLGGGSAAAADYGSPTFSNGVTLAAGVLTVPAGVTSFTVTLPTTQDTLNEVSETVPLSVGGVAGTGTITDNDPTPSLSINDVSVNEAAGTATFTVTLSAASGQSVSVGYASADGSATGADYTAAAGTLTFAPGVTSQTVTVAITNDTVFEASETFNINLSSPVNATIADGTGVGTIVDNDAAPTIATVSSPTVVEGTDLVYSIALSNASSTATTFAYSLGGGSAAAADYGSPTFSNGVTLAAGVLTVPAGVTSFTVTLPTTQDTLNETSETVPLSVGGVAGTGTITDNDPTPSLTINDVSVNEAAGTATFTVTLSAASGQAVSVGYASANGSATAASDYTAAAGTLTFAPGVTSQTVTVAITNDTVFEASETFNINLSSPVNATISDGTGVGTIVDNDGAPVIASVSSPTVVEGTDLVYSVALSNASSSASTFAYSLGGGSAGATDYGSPTFSNGVTLAAGVLTVPAGVTSFTVTLPTTQDTLNETSETVPLSVGGVAATGTITDNDPTPSLSINDVSVNEAAGTATFTVTLSTASGQSVSVGYSSANGSAIAGSDYTAVSGTLSFAPGVTSQTITVPITNDLLAEASEAFSINLGSPTNATIADGLGVATITDNDFAPVLDLDANNSSTATGANYITSYTENAVGVAIADADVSLTDTDSATLAGATVTLANAQTGDVLAVGTLPAGISAVVAGNVVTLTGTASLAAYQTALRAITFANTTDTPNTTPRSITVVVTDGFNSSNVATTTVNVIAVNDAPAGIDRAVSTGEDIPYRFSAADFRMNDAEEGANVAPSAVRIDTLPTNGTLTLNGTTVTAGQVLTPTDVGNLSFTPAANANGANYANFAFSVRDSSGAFDPSPNTLTISVSARVDLSVQDVQHWTFNEGSGTTTANNYASAAQTGTRTDGITAGDSDLRPTFTANGHEGAAMQFNGVYTGVRDGGYVALPTAVTDPLRGGAAGGGSASLAFWIKTTQTGGTIGWDSPSVIGMENNGGTSDVQWGWINSAGRIGFGLANEAGVLSTNPINNNQWHQVTINHNFTTGATEVWVDGTLNSSGIVSPGAVMPNHFLGFGVTNDDGLASDRYLNGTLDDIRIYDRTLTASQIQAIYAVESNNLGANAVLDNDGGAVRFNIAANDHASVLISGAPIGSSLTDGTNTVVVTADGQSVDVSSWNHSLLSVTGMGTNSAMLSVTATGATAGDSVTQYINIVTGSTAFNGTAGNDTQNGTSGSDFIGGGAGNDTITAGDGHDRIFGGANNDTINAGNGNDVIVGGAGNDTMTGGAGADVFQWQLADRGIAGTPAADVISDFDPASRAAGGDVLDLRDLLVGENRVGGTGNLDQYLDFDTTSTPGSTIIRISSSGSFAGGTYAAGQEDERITLTGVDLRSTFGLGSGSTDAQVIQELLNRNKLITDGP